MLCLVLYHVGLDSIFTRVKYFRIVFNPEDISGRVAGDSEAAVICYAWQLGWSQTDWSFTAVLLPPAVLRFLEIGIEPSRGALSRRPWLLT